MKCDDVQEQLTAYLDGELADDRGSAIRGHLRSCDACRGVASDESSLRDGLRDLPPVQPPASLWANVQAQLANAEVADAQKPAWRRTLGRWARMLAPSWPQLALGGVAAAAVVTFVVWRSEGSQDPPPSEVPNVAKTTPPVAPTASPPARDHGDVTADLAGEAARVTDSYADAAEELLALANEERVQWSATERDTFDAHVADLRREIDDAMDGRPKQKAWRALIRYLQNAAVRDEVALASGGAP
ncbi:MAG: anti-sigma factor family protein [Kofleriaceae bacterium]